MSNTILLGLSGSLRKASHNRQLIREAARLFQPDRFIEGDLNLPLYDGDLEDAKGIPASVQALADQIAQADAIVISTPEYNQSLSGVLKNALDWISRTQGGPWKGKPVALISAAAGRSGGARGNYALRLAMQPFRTHLLQGEFLLAGAAKEFGEDGKLIDEKPIKLLAGLMDDLRDAAGLEAIARD
jgi:chromate reductase